MFKTRLISGIILVLVALVTIISGGILLWGTLLGLSIIGLGEIYRAMGLYKGKISTLEAGAYISLILYYLSLLWEGRAYNFAALFLGFILIMAIYVFTYPKYKAHEIMAAFFGLVYVAIMLSFVYHTRMWAPKGIYMVWLIFLSSWGCDTCAYCVGVLIGKHKMAPVLSPKKSIEGAFGGLIGAALLGYIYGLITGGSPFVCAIICLTGGAISMVGDLAASAIKRDKQIKDYGKLIPGHGGVLDRFDSVIFTAPIIYYLACLLVK